MSSFHEGPKTSKMGWDEKIPTIKFAADINQIFYPDPNQDCNRVDQPAHSRPAVWSSNWEGVILLTSAPGVQEEVNCPKNVSREGDGAKSQILQFFFVGVAQKKMG